MIVYMEITQDDLALPLCVCDYLDQMAEKTGLRKVNISSQIGKAIRRKQKYPRFIKVEIEEDLEDFIEKQEEK